MAGTASGGGLFAGAGGSEAPNRVFLANTIVALNGGAASDVSGTVDPFSRHNLIGTGGDGLTDGSNGNLIGVADPRLGTLANNGGPTKTIALLAGSPALNAGDNERATINGQLGRFSIPLQFDQRGTGFPRILDGRVDIGAVEISVRPVLTSTLPGVTSNEGSQATNSGTFDSLHGRDTVTLTASVGTVAKNDAAGTWSWSYTPSDGPSGPTTVTITATDDYGLTATTTFTLTVNNVAPTAAITGAPASGHSPEGTAISLGSSVTDPSPADTTAGFTYAWSVTRNGAAYASGSAANFSFTPDDDGIYVVSLFATDKDGGISPVAQTNIVVDDVAPTIAISGANTANAGAAYTLTLGAVADPGADTVTHYIVNWGDGSSDTYTTGGAKTHVYPTGATTYAITVDLVAEDGTHVNRANALSVTVNAPPTVAVPDAQTAYEDVDLAIGGISVGDPDGGSLTVTLAVGRGTVTLGTTAGLTVTGNGTAVVTLSGSIANLNAALATLLYRGNLNYSGADTLNVMVSDGSLSANGSVGINVKSAFQQAADLQARVTALRAAGVLNQGQANALIVKLKLKGNNGDADKVQSFLAQVRDFLRAGLLTQAQADDLLFWGNLLLLSVTRQ